MSAARVAVATSGRAVEHVFAEPITDPVAARIGAVIDPVFLTEAGWDPGCRVLRPPASHPLLGRPVCQAAGCWNTATCCRSRICVSCRARLAKHGLGEDEIAALRARTSKPTFTAVPDGPRCAVAACTRRPRHREGAYCQAHQIRWRAVHERDPGMHEQRWRRIEPAIGRGGEVSLRGLPQLVVAEVMFGLQQRCQINAVKTDDAVLRSLCDDLRRQQVTTIADYALAADRGLEFKGLANCLVSHAGRALATPETEVVKDEWDLVVFGHSGTISFGNITQPWLRETAKRWAADDLPKRRVRPGRRTSAGLAVRHHIGCLVRLSESLRMRPDRGEHPAGLGRDDMQAFLHRLAYLESVGQISDDARIRACREVRAVLTRARAMGLTRPGGIAAGLGDDFVIAVTDIPLKPAPAEPNRDLPPEIMQQLCARLDELTTPETRTAVELAIDTGRRPEEICDLDFDCLARDEDGAPALIYDNHKANRPGRRLPISEHTAALIVTQQQRIRARYPDTPVGQLKLLPTDRRNPGGRRAITAFSLAFAHRVWVDKLPVLRTSDGIEYDKRKIVLYAYRHSYAQRHADAGVPVEVLRELMSHRKLETTSGYYRIGETRRRDAVDRVTAMQFDRHGNRTWRQAQTLLDSEHARRAIGEVAVPFGVCAEPSNVKAGGGACPFRFRCAGCDHFRTDVSYLPDLHAYLDDLLRTRERLLATTDLDDWARAEAMPSDDEIGRIRRLIARISGSLDDLAVDQREHLQQAVATVRHHRSVMLGMPRVRQALPDLRPERTR
ncbi:MAG TPA: tyrosine-type recombinase/integrase [Pseudonocardiaceae bacterium]|jgi:integrase